MEQTEVAMEAYDAREDAMQQIRYRADVGAYMLSAVLHLRFRPEQEVSLRFLSHRQRYLKERVDYLFTHPDVMSLICQNRAINPEDTTFGSEIVERLYEGHLTEENAQWNMEINNLCTFLKMSVFQSRWSVEIPNSTELYVIGKVAGIDCRFHIDIHPGNPHDLAGVFIGEAEFEGFTLDIIEGFKFYKDILNFLNVFMDLA